MARSQVARCESSAALATPVDPLVRKIADGSSLVPTRGSGALDAPSSHAGDVTTTRRPIESAIDRAGSS